MEVYGTKTYVLNEADTPLVVVHKGNTVSLHYQAWSDMPEGFTIHFLPVHIEVLEELVAALRRKALDANLSGEVELHFSNPQQLCLKSLQ